MPEYSGSRAIQNTCCEVSRQHTILETVQAGNSGTSRRQKAYYRGCLRIIPATKRSEMGPGDKLSGRRRPQSTATGSSAVVLSATPHVIGTFDKLGDMSTVRP